MGIFVYEQRKFFNRYLSVLVAVLEALKPKRVLLANLFS
ncbi:hypothetical protein CYPRO_3215 [Cyclonatronum proteinivorum]|uniref:Uncharacterized protein n=1 Tax=Cyclonatronum proteinivorum TaxID=1457365 RepID=A0A345UPP6_9BACT|nr:hypothetical protein CYPRO_3215 [Cyclonatronum proteinivorum]